jgi:hypothetical protein
MERNTKPPPLEPGAKLFFGVLLPNCGFALMAFFRSHSFGPGEAGGFAALGFVMSAFVIGRVGLILDLWVVAVPFRERLTVFFAGCVIPFILFLLIASR